MDTPLLALTRRPPASLGVPPRAVAADNMRQLVQLRWLAVAGQLLTVLAVGAGLRVPLPWVPLLGVIAGLAVANLSFTVLLHRQRITNAALLYALLFDVAALALQLYLTGGAENPFVSLFLVQVVLGAILLDAWAAWLLAAVACASVAVLTHASIPLRIPPGLLPQAGDLFTLGEWISFLLVSTLLVLFSTRVSRNLRAREAYLSDLRSRGAEEDRLLRMGLFASGAAHELGTPLATLSVILGDWRHMPRLADDPELAVEIAEMEGEVARCKAIVTSILDTVVPPRGEAPGRVEAGAFLDEVVAAWQEHPHAPAPLEYRRSGLDGTVLLADPALRQAIWNLLDNAAEASPSGVTLEASAAKDLAITVTDRGPGFSAPTLASVGEPIVSRKGRGHGVGLYLASSVARRLGGSLEAANADRGAKVRIVLPLERLP